MFIHFIIGFIMFSNSTLLSSDLTENSDYLDFIEYSNYYFNYSRFSQLHTSIYLGGFLVLMILYFLKEFLYQSCSCCLQICLGPLLRRFAKLRTLSDDFYNDLPLPYLFKELERSVQEKRSLENRETYGEFRDEQSVV